jgi:hypothetical protein
MHDYFMVQEWVPRTAQELRRLADTLRKLAAAVSDRELAHRLELHAAELSAMAEAKSPLMR